MDHSRKKPLLREWRYGHQFLLLSLVLVVVVKPFLDQTVIGDDLMNLVLFANLAIATITMGPGRLPLMVLAVSGMATLTGWALLLTHGEEWLFVTMLSSALFYATVATTSVIYLLQHATTVSANTLCAMCSVYLILGIFWTFVYSLLELNSPGSFIVENTPTVSGQFERFMGFSFATLTTLGYGNVAPANPRADALTTSQAVVGQFYIAVVVARLIAMHLTQSRMKRRAG